MKFVRRIAGRLRRIVDPFRGVTPEWSPSEPPYHGQWGQDRCLHELFGNRRRGVFVDVGAHDGVSFSNTVFFERELDWRGLCIEPIPEVYQLLVRQRNSICVQACVARQAGVRKFLRVHGYAEMLSGMLDAYDARHVETIQSEMRRSGGTSEVVETRTVRLDTLLHEHQVTSIDLLCVDVEGAELEVLRSLDLKGFHPKVICVENNFGDPLTWFFLMASGYRPFRRIGRDEVYLSRAFDPAVG